MGTRAKSKGQVKKAWAAAAKAWVAPVVAEVVEVVEVAPVVAEEVALVIETPVTPVNTGTWMPAGYIGSAGFPIMVERRNGTSPEPLHYPEAAALYAWLSSNMPAPHAYGRHERVVALLVLEQVGAGIDVSEDINFYRLGTFLKKFLSEKLAEKLDAAHAVNLAELGEGYYAGGAIRMSATERDAFLRWASKVNYMGSFRVVCDFNPAREIEVAELKKVAAAYKEFVPVYAAAMKAAAEAAVKAAADTAAAVAIEAGGYASDPTWIRMRKNPSAVVNLRVFNGAKAVEAAVLDRINAVRGQFEAAEGQVARMNILAAFKPRVWYDAGNMGILPASIPIEWLGGLSINDFGKTQPEWVAYKTAEAVDKNIRALSTNREVISMQDVARFDGVWFWDIDVFVASMIPAASYEATEAADNYFASSFSESDDDVHVVVTKYKAVGSEPRFDLIGK